ncbi:hypothetical protein PGB90_006690 [Kerria lacca]
MAIYPEPKVPLKMVLKTHWTLIIPVIAFFIGDYIDNQDQYRMIKYRDRSGLYGGRVKPGDPPTWP